MVQSTVSLQGPRVTADGSSLSLLGPLPPGGPGFFTMDFFSAMTDCKGQWRQHNAALKWFRLRCERERIDEGFLFSNSHVTAVAAIVHPAGMQYWFVEEEMREWSWHEMVAQLDRKSLTYVVEGDNRSRGLVGCEFRPRRNSYDHARQVQGDAPNHQLPDWDFILVRSDGSAVRLHPDWNKPKIPTFAVQGHDEPVEIPLKGLGKSDGKGTFRRYRTLGQEETLRFDSSRGTFV